MNRFDSTVSLSGIFSGENRKPTVILLLTPVLITAFKYLGAGSFYIDHIAGSFVLFGDPQWTAACYHFFSSLLLFGLVPVLVVKLVFDESLASYGLQAGDWRFGWKAVAVLLPVMILATYPTAGMPAFLAEYPLARGAGASAQTFAAHAAVYLAYYVGWEVFFRGFLQFGLRRAFGDWNAILVQTVASCLIHIGKPGAEIVASIPAGIIWGIVAFRSRSIMYVLVIHWLVGVSLDFFICFVR